MGALWQEGLIAVVSGVVSGLIVALIVARVRLFRPPEPDRIERSIPDRVPVDIPHRDRRPPSKSKGEATRTTSDEDNGFPVAFLAAVVAVSVFARFLEALTNLLLAMSVGTGVAFLTAVTLLMVRRIRLKKSAWILLTCGAIGAVAGIVSARAIVAVSPESRDLDSLGDWLALLYLTVGWATALLVVFVSLWALLVVLASAGLQLGAPGQGFWEFVSRKSAPVWWYALVTLVGGAIAVGMSTGWAYNWVSNLDFGIPEPAPSETASVDPG